MEQPSDPEERLKIALTDEQLLANNNYSLCKTMLPAESRGYIKDPAEALKKFIALRNNHIKYIRTSTEDMRNHVVATPAGWIDCYLLLADRSRYFAEMIDKIKSSPHFPKK
jgi:hypothetical protein